MRQPLRTSIVACSDVTRGYVSRGYLVNFDAMEIDYKHALTEEDARARLERLGSYLGNKHGIKVDWNGPKAKFIGKYLLVTIDGELAVAPGVVTFRGADPGFLWRKKATQYIQGKLEKYLDPKLTLADLPTDG